jgi:hypothetical protein
MSESFDDLLHLYFDDQLSESEHRSLEEAIRSNPDHARRFVEQAMLHDQLHNAWFASRELNELSSELPMASASLTTAETSSKTASSFRSRYSLVAVAASVGFLLLSSIVFWGSVCPSRASASAVELERLIKLAESVRDRAYLIEVEETVAGVPKWGKRKTPEGSRPPKPSLDGAKLYTRGESLFVLVRKPEEDKSIITGFDGETSWSVRSEGPVKTSKDPNAFNRDVPGHEHSMSFTDIRQTLETLKRAYVIELLPVETSESEDNVFSESSRLIVAIKRKGEKGPRRVEINYLVESGRIIQIRFIDMPFGPDRLTLRMTLMDESDLDPNFFHHEYHHPAFLPVESE